MNKIIRGLLGGIVIAASYGKSLESSEIPSRKKANSFYLSESVIINKPVSNVFNFVLKDLQTYYSKTAKGHEEFKVIDAEEISEGKFIECSETVDNVELHHRFEIKKVIKNKHIHFCTDLSKSPTRVFIHTGKKIMKNKSGTDVYYDFKNINSKQTQVTLTIVIQMSSFFSKLMGLITGSKKLVSNHLFEETHGLKRVIEKYSE